MPNYYISTGITKLFITPVAPTDIYPQWNGSHWPAYPPPNASTCFNSMQLAYFTSIPAIPPNQPAAIYDAQHVLENLLEMLRAPFESVGMED